MLINITFTCILGKLFGGEERNSTATLIQQWQISRFRGIYRTLTAFEMELFLIWVKDFRPLYNVRRSSLIVVEGVLYLPPCFIITAEQYTLDHHTRTNYCSCEVGCPFVFVSFNFFICLNLIHETTISSWHTTSILSFGIIYLWWHEGKGYRADGWCHLNNIMPVSISCDPVIIES